jgi:glycosyltransferase involved in cell wall biosynthesis
VNKIQIGIDIFSFDKLGENYGVGPGIYVWHLLPRLFEYGKDIKFYVFGNKENESLIPKADNVKVIINPLPNKFRPFRIVHEQVFLPIFAIKHKLDLVHFFGNNISYLISNKAIITIHDLMWKYYLDHGYINLKNIYFLLTVPKSIKKAKGIITVSSYIRQQIFNYYKKDLNQIIKIYEAPCLFKQPNEEQIRIFDTQFDYKFIFTVTTSMPHKNLKILLKAFQKLKNKYEGKLLIAGQLKGKYHTETLAFIKENNLENEILLLGFISEELKAYLYRKADFIVYPSLYEGFGLPVLEALSAGNIVLASNAASIPEIGGQACLYFDPLSIEDLFNKMLYLIENPSFKNKNVEIRLNHLKNFSWDKTAKETLLAYKYFLKC